MGNKNFDKSIEISEIRPKVFHAKFKNQYMATATFMRISEFYESTSPEIRNSYFTLEEYMDRYAEKMGNFTYTVDWSGFNIPGDKVVEFFKLFGRKLLEKEKILYKNLKSMVPSKNWKSGDFYLIGTWRKMDVDHEVSHAYYYLHPEYKSAVNRLVKNYKYKDDLKKALVKEGYCEFVFKDECQAYLATSTKKYLTKEMKFDEKWCLPRHISRFKKLFKEFDKEMKKTMEEME